MEPTSGKDLCMKNNRLKYPAKTGIPAAMDGSVLPSRMRRIVSGQSPRDDDLLPPEDAETRRISATALAKSSQCLLRGLWAAAGQKGLPASPFSKASFDDGKEFETQLLQDRNCHLWIAALNDALHEQLPADLPLHNGSALKRSASESAEDYSRRAKEALDAAVFTAGSAAGKEAFCIREPVLAVAENGILLEGRPDFLVWTGKRWIIADIKCSESAKRNHGIQIVAYGRMLKALRPDDEIEPRGAVIHCSPGWRYCADSRQDLKEQCLSHTIATAFPLASLQPEADKLIAALRDATKPESIKNAVDGAVFTPVCNECEYRHLCHPRFLNRKHVSLVPFPRAELEAVTSKGIHTIDDVISAIDSGSGEQYETLFSLKGESKLQLKFLRQKAEKVLAGGIYSAWRANPEAVREPLFFVSTPSQQSLFEPRLENAVQPSCLVVYTEAERRRAWAEILEKKKHWAGVQVFILGEEIQQSLHGPIPSLTLRPLAEFLGAIQQCKSLADVEKELKKYFQKPESIASAMEDSADPAERMKHLKTVWKYLQSAAVPFAIEWPPDAALEPNRRGQFKNAKPQEQAHENI